MFEDGRAGYGRLRLRSYKDVDCIRFSPDERQTAFQSSRPVPRRIAMLHRTDESFLDHFPKGFAPAQTGLASQSGASCGRLAAGSWQETLCLGARRA